MLLSEILTALRLEFCTFACNEFSFNLRVFENIKYSCITEVAISVSLREYKNSKRIQKSTVNLLNVLVAQSIFRYTAVQGN